MTATLRAERISVVANDRQLLRDVTLAVSPGEVVALAGPNGAGKSTLLRALAGDTTLAAGQVFVDDRPINHYHPRELALRRAVLPQQTIIQFAFTVREIVEMGRGPRRGHNDEVVVSSALKKTETAPLAHRPFPSLSGGEQARVTLARVLAQEAPIVLLDEPTAALDLRHQQLVMRLAHEIATAGGLVVVVLHDLNLAAGFADRIVLLADGEILADGPPWQTLTASRLSELFRCPITVTSHPITGVPLILPLSLDLPSVASTDASDDNQQQNRADISPLERKDEQQDAEQLDHQTGNRSGYAMRHR